MLAYKGALLLVLACVVAAVGATPLDDYVNAPDSAFNWTVTGSKRAELLGYTTYSINMISQSWLPKETNQKVHLVRLNSAAVVLLLIVLNLMSFSTNVPLVSFSTFSPAWQVWRHWLLVCVPDNIDTSIAQTAFLYIDGGHTNDPAPTANIV